MKHEMAHQRGKGDVGGPSLPMNKSAEMQESNIKNSMKGTDMGDLAKGYCSEGSIKGATKSDPGKGD